MTIIAMNRWKIPEESVAQDFRKDWEQLTGEMLASCGAISNTLHRSDSGDFVAIAVWPSREAWENSAIGQHTHCVKSTAPIT